MTLIVTILLSIVFFIVVGLSTGYLLLRDKLNRNSLFSVLSIGTVCNIILFCLISTLMSVVNGGLMVTGIVWCLVLFGIALYNLIRSKKRVPEDLKQLINDTALGNKFKGRSGESACKTRGSNLLWLIWLVLVVLQIALVFIFANNSANSIRQIMYATKAYDTGELSISSPIMMLWAFLAKLSGCHPLTIIFSLSQFVMIPLYYMIGWIVADKAVEKVENKHFMMICLCLLNLWGYQSEYLINETLLFSWFSGTVFVVCGILPVSLWLYLNKEKCKQPDTKEVKDKTLKDTGELSYYEWEEEDMKNHKIVNARTVAVALLVVAAMLLASVYIMNKKINSLYSTTANVVEQVNSGCSIYEFSPSDDSATTTYLIKQSDGKIDVVGGGPAEDGENLYNFIKQYGNNINTWYLYGEDEANKGAYDFCVMDGEISVDNTYVIKAEKLN